MLYKFAQTTVDTMNTMKESMTAMIIISNSITCWLYIFIVFTEKLVLSKYAIIEKVTHQNDNLKKIITQKLALLVQCNIK